MVTLASRPAFGSGISKRRSAAKPTVIAIIALIAVFFGVAITVVGGLFAVALLGLLACIALLAAPRATVWVTAFGGVVVAGLVELYLPGLQLIRWVFALLSIALAVISTFHWLAGKRRRQPAMKDESALSVSLIVFICAAVFSLVFGEAGVKNAIVGLKNYFQMWGLMLALAWLGYKPIDAKRFVTFLGILSLVQMPFVLHQFFVLVPQRSGSEYAAHLVVAVDIVAGTFGGSMVGGGRSADLALLSAFAATLFFAQWKLGQRSLRSALLLSAVAFAPTVLNEAKLALALLPLGMFLLFRRTIVERPFMWIFSASLFALLMAAILVFYSALPGAGSQRSKSVGEYLSSVVDYNLGDRGYGGVVLNRTSVYRFWWSEHGRTGNWRHALFGHGLGYSNSANLQRGETLQASRYAGYGIGLTGLSSLLWDAGVAGTLAFLLVVFRGYRLGNELAEKWRGTCHEPFVRAVQIGFPMIGLSLLHNDFVAFDVGFQTLMALFMGYLFAMARAPRAQEQ